jgi:hypothetical protein
VVFKLRLLLLFILRREEKLLGLIPETLLEGTYREAIPCVEKFFPQGWLFLYFFIQPVDDRVTFFHYHGFIQVYP